MAKFKWYTTCKVFFYLLDTNFRVTKRAPGAGGKRGSPRVYMEFQAGNTKT